MNKKSILYLILIVVASILLRLWNLDKPEGMWNDEFLTWKIASAKLPFDFFEALRSNCHAPLHYLYLKLWMYLFHDNDTMLRLSSVVPGVLGIIVMYFAGLEFKKKDDYSTALSTALVCALSSFLIYFSQEIRIYSLVFFITSLVLLYAFKIFNNPSSKNFFFYSLFSLLLILTHTIGFVFVLFSTAALLVFAVPKKKSGEFILFSTLGVVLLALPFIPLISSILFKTGYFSQWWAPFNFSRTLFLFTDVFSPVLNDTSHVFNTFSDAFYKNGVVNLGYFVFAIIPTLIALICFIKGALNPKRVQGYLLLTLFCTILTVLIAAMAGKIVFVTKYMIEIVPVFILLACDGFSSFKSKAFKISIATVYIVLNLFFITVSQTSAVNLVREEGQRLPVITMNHLGLKKNDRILFLYYPSDWYFKYVDFKNPDNAPYLSAMCVTKYSFVFYLKSGLTKEDAYRNGKELLREAFAVNKNVDLDGGLDNEIFRKLKSGDRFFIVDLTSVSFFPMSVINKIAKENGSAYKNAPLLYLAMSYVKNYTLERANKELVYDGYQDNGSWRVYVFKKA